MKKHVIIFCMVVSAVLILVPLQSLLAADYQKQIVISSSAQAYDAFIETAIKTFEKENAIKVAVFVCSSKVAVDRVDNDYAQIAVSTEDIPIRYSYRESGYKKIEFCKDALAVITNEGSDMNGITTEQIRSIFSGQVINQKDVGGSDQEFVIVAPDKNTAAYHNFCRQVMGREDVKYDVATYTSTDTIKMVKLIPGAISFISHGTLYNKKGIKVLPVNCVSPKDDAYPYSQTFSFIIKRSPGKTVTAFIDFPKSEKGQAIILERGMVPIPY